MRKTLARRSPVVQLQLVERIALRGKVAFPARLEGRPGFIGEGDNFSVRVAFDGRDPAWAAIEDACERRLMFSLPRRVDRPRVDMLCVEIQQEFPTAPTYEATLGFEILRVGKIRAKGKRAS